MHFEPLCTTYGYIIYYFLQFDKGFLKNFFTFFQFFLIFFDLFGEASKRASRKRRFSQKMKKRALFALSGLLTKV